MEDLSDRKRGRKWEKVMKKEREREKETLSIDCSHWVTIMKSYVKEMKDWFNHDWGLVGLIILVLIGKGEEKEKSWWKEREKERMKEERERGEKVNRRPDQGSTFNK